MKFLIGLMCAFSMALWAQEPDAAAEQEAWMAFLTPGQPHTDMAQWAGTFDVKSKHWMDPNAEPTEAEGKMVNTLAMGGRYLVSSHTSSFMGMPFEGMNVQGYDNAKKMYVSVWIDNMGTGFMYTEGNYNDQGELVMTGTMSSPMGDLKVREVMTTEGTDKQTLVMYFEMMGQEMKAMEVVMTRTK